MIFKSFHSPEVTNNKRVIARFFIFGFFSLYSQKYRGGWKIFKLYFWFILSHIWLNLPIVYRHFFYIFLWMIAILATKKNSFKKNSTATTLFVLLMSAVDESGAAWWWWQNIETCIGRRAVGCGVWPGDKTRPTRLNPIQPF